MGASAISGHWFSAILIARRMSPIATSRCTRSPSRRRPILFPALRPVNGRPGLILDLDLSFIVNLWLSSTVIPRLRLGHAHHHVGTLALDVEARERSTTRTAYCWPPVMSVSPNSPLTTGRGKADLEGVDVGQVEDLDLRRVDPVQRADALGGEHARARNARGGCPRRRRTGRSSA